jgi:hypothetical protein
MFFFFFKKIKFIFVFINAKKEQYMHTEMLAIKQTRMQI